MVRGIRKIGAQLKIIGLNVQNRSYTKTNRARKFFAWADALRVDVICLQETQREKPLPEYTDIGLGYADAEAYLPVPKIAKLAANGVAILSRYTMSDRVKDICSEHVSCHARYLQVLTGGVIVVSVYAPTDSAKDEQHEKHVCFLKLDPARLRGLYRYFR